MSAPAARGRALPRRAAVALTVAGAAVALGGWVGVQDGVEYDCRVTVTTTDHAGRVTRAPAVVARTRTSGLRARVDFTAGNDEIRAGDYMLTADGGRTLTVVSPARRQYTNLTPSTFGEQLAAELGDRATVRDPSVETTRWSSDSVRRRDGVPVERVRIARSFQLRLRMLLVRRDVQVQETSDYWVNPTLRDVPNPLARYLVATAAAPVYADASLAARVRAAEVAVAAAFPVRWVHRSVTESRKRRQETVTTLEIGPVVRHEPDAAIFALPAGYVHRAPR